MRSASLTLRRRLSRRTFLKGAGAGMALPFLDAMTPAFAGEEQSEPPRRMFAICNNLGLLPDRFFPQGTGRGYVLSTYLAELADHRDDFTVLSGVSHPGVDGSHSSDVSFLTAAPHPGGGGFRNTVSLDQFVAGQIGHLTRFPSLTLGVNAQAGRRSLSWTDSGALIPCENRPSDVYRKLFLQGSQEEIDCQMRRLRLGESIMDAVAEDARALSRRLGASDRERLDQYTTSVREVERRLVKSRDWERQPKPEPSVSMPADPADRSAYMESVRLMYQIARLAFETDSTRSITLLLDSNNSPAIRVEGARITDGYHNLSHHGLNEDKINQLDAIDRSHMRLLGGLLGDMKQVEEGDATMLGNTLVMYGSNFGDANKHTTDNMPVVIAGGRLMHGQHLGFDRSKNYPLPNLFVTMLQSMGIEAHHFASSTGTMRGLEVSA